ncbi:hypothetical protein J2768_002864 [Agrobacterium tumefaciens]|uniref:hypothetical protein n=1 Tax=Agrobacterium tumefaciens TaxID=358 RepID=UPI001AEB46FF|nr:hypothetical protein [Agrobacterium tumefaciens]MBP2540427.1 hypothetical protein [Agrobacterium tumefaciens]
MDNATFQSETLIARMARFDALPPAVRQAINLASFEFHPGMAERLLRRGASDHSCAARLVITDRGLSARQGGA